MEKQDLIPGKPQSFKYWMEMCKHHIPGFEITEHNEEAYKLVYAWYARDESIEGFDVNKGILITGPVGTGKTEVLRMLQKLINSSDHYLPLKLCPVWQVANNFGNNGYDVFNKFSGGNWFFDELGLKKEREVVSYFGNKIDVADALILQRYNDFKTKRNISFFTTNLSKEGLKERYSEQAISRLKEMCNIVTMAGPDLREKARTKAAMVAEEEKKKISPKEILDHQKAFLQSCILIPYKNCKAQGYFDRNTFYLNADKVYRVLNRTGLVGTNIKKLKRIYRNERQKTIKKGLRSFDTKHRNEYREYKDSSFEAKKKADKLGNRFYRRTQFNCRMQCIRQLFEVYSKLDKDLEKIIYSNIDKL